MEVLYDLGSWSHDHVGQLAVTLRAQGIDFTLTPLELVVDKDDEAIVDAIVTSVEPTPPEPER